MNSPLPKKHDSIAWPSDRPPSARPSSMSVRSCTGHIATSIAEKFSIEPHRMLYIEFYPKTVYGSHKQHVIAEKYDAVDFTWNEGKAIAPKWRTLKPPILDVIKQLVEGNK